MANHRIAVLGCGYLGSALTRRLVADGHHCIATTTTPERLPDLRALGAQPVVLQLSETTGLHELLSDRECVFLTAGPGRREADYRRVFLQGARSLVEALDNTAVTHLVYTSSTGVYAQDDGQWVDEDAPTRTTSDHRGILADTERTILQGAASLNITATVLRLGGIYGPRRHPAERIRQHAGQHLDDGHRFLNLIHRDDAVAVMIALLDLPYPGILNITDGRPITRRDLYDPVIAAAGLAPIHWADTPSSTTRGKRVRIDRAIRNLGFAPQHRPDHPSPA